MAIHHGGCLCGAVRYQARGALREVIYCHCGQCRRQTGLYYATTEVAQIDLTVTGAALRWFASSAFAQRGFCGTCGSALFWKPEGRAHIAILAGSLDAPVGLVAAAHICTEGRPDFYPICDGLPQYPHSAPGVEIDGA